jgi:hypothetical protein
MILQILITMVAGWINRHQQHVITYLKEENRVLTAKLPSGRLRLTDTERRRLAKLAHPLNRKQLKDTATIATPDTLMRWYKRLVADKFNGSKNRWESVPVRVTTAVICLLSSGGWPNSLVMQDQRDVSSLARGMMSPEAQALSIPLQDGLRFFPPPSPARQSACLAVRFPWRETYGVAMFRPSHRRMGEARSVHR